MMGREELADLIASYNPDSDRELILRAYDFAQKAHAHQKRKSGEPYFIHPVAVAEILARLELDDASIATGLLHDTVEDTEVTREDIDHLFGSDVGLLVDGVTKLDSLDLVTKQAEQAENFRKLLIAISADVRVLLVKLADRLHNMRTMEHMKEKKQRLISRETMEIYAPLAGRMGIGWMRSELEDLAFRWLYPKAREAMIGHLRKFREDYRELVAEIESELHLKLEEYGIRAEVTSREKKPYSIWRKMENRQISLEQLCDIYGFRIITETVEDCYKVLGVIHTSWQIVPGRFKDYISVPKPNDYKSIHTTVIGPEKRRVEIQIRTRQMHEVDEYGIAAHTLYKESIGRDDEGDKKLLPKHELLQDSSAYKWLRQLVETLREGDNPEELLEHTRLELFQDQLFTFTPKGRLIVLPKKATPIDFAYAVHTDIGDTCVRARINGQPMPIMTELRNGDEVEIICSPGHKPPSTWENIAVTGKAKSAIRRINRKAVQAQYSRMGKEIVHQAFTRANLEFNQNMLASKLHRLPQNSLDEVYAAIGRGEMDVELVIVAIYPGFRHGRNKKQRKDQGKGKGKSSWRDAAWLRRARSLHIRWTKAGEEKKPREGAIPIRGTAAGLPVRFASKGGALPGERIVGIMTPGEGVTIYPIYAEALKRYDNQPERWVDVTWDIDPDNRQRFPAMISVTTVNMPGSLAKIAQLIGEADANIDKLRMVKRQSDYTEMLIGLEVWDLKHLIRIIKGLQAMKIVSQAHRVQG